MLYAARLAATVETSASGEFEPSLVRKIGSLPLLQTGRSHGHVVLGLMAGHAPPPVHPEIDEEKG